MNGCEHGLKCPDMACPCQCHKDADAKLKAIVDEAHGWGKKVACHAYNGIGMRRALDGGCDSIEHGLELTDAGSFEWTDPKSPIAMEFPRMVELGMTPMQAIKSATSVPAVMLDMEGEIGVVAPGAFADIIAVEGDPSRDVNVLKNVGFVVTGGKVFKNDLK